MAIIINNGITLPTDEDFIIGNGSPVTRVIANGVLVWEQQKETIVASDITKKGDNLVKISVPHDFTGFSQVRIIATAEYANETRGPYDYVRIFIGSDTYDIPIMDGTGYQTMYNVDKTFDIDGQTGIKSIEVEAGYANINADFDVEITLTIEKIILIK